MAEGFYFGRFQPPLLKHAEIARTASTTYPDLHLTIGVADNQIPPLLTQDNFLHGAEVQGLFIETLEYLGISDIEVRLVPLPAQPFIVSLRDFFQRSIQTSDRPVSVFSGSGSTIKACQELSADIGLEIINLNDDDQTGPRARQIRQALMEGNLDGWQHLVAPSVVEYLSKTETVQRIQLLPPAPEKRPWSVIPDLTQ